jgi:hypothetical protein
MADRVRFDSRDKAALRKLDTDFTIAADGEVATIAGNIEIEIVRVAGERFQLTLNFPGGMEFPILLSRSRTLEQLGFRDESVPEQ